MKAKRDAKNQMKTHVQNFTLTKPHWYIFKKHRNFGEIISQARNATFYFCSKSSESYLFKALCTKIVKQTSVSTLYIQHWVNDACGGEGSLTSKLMKVVVLKNSKAGA